MEERKKKLLTEYLDKTLLGEQLSAHEAMLLQDAAAQEEWAFQHLAVEAIRHEALTMQVAAIKEQYLADKKKRLFLLRKPVAAAAAVLLLVGAAAVYKYASVTASGFFKDQYAAYELPVTRGGTADELLKAYQQQQWKTVLKSFEVSQKNNQQWFLAGIANMQSGEYKEAVQKFEQVLANNQYTGDSYYHDEAEYYLAMALLASNDAARAISILKRIEADSAHLYHKKVMDLRGLNRKILEYKTGASN